jgi:flagellar assembly protein FliH
MSARLDLVGASVLPFQFPTLGERGMGVPGVPVPDADSLSNTEADAPPVALNGGGAAPEDAAAAAAEAAEAEFAQARAEGLRRGLEEGRQDGYAAGYAEGVKNGEAALVEVTRRLTSIAATLGSPITALERPVEEAIVALSLEVARCVIGGEVKRSHEFLVRLVREAIAKVPLEMGSPRVLLNPADLELVRQLVSETDLGKASLIAEDAIEAGGCLVVADGADQPIMDRRWNPRAVDGVSQVNLTLSSRWREVMLTLFDGEDE